MKTLSLFGRDRGRFAWLPLAGAWTKHRDFPVPEGETFQTRFARERGRREGGVREGR